MTYSKFDPGCDCCGGGCDLVEWPGVSSTDFSAFKNAFDFFGSSAATEDWNDFSKIRPGSHILSKDSLINQSSWIWQQVVDINLDHDYAVRWIAHATPLDPEHEDYETKGPLGDHLFAEVRPIVRPYGHPTIVAKLSLGMVVDGIETVFDTTFHGEKIPFFRYGKLCLVNRPVEGQFESLVDPDSFEFGGIVTTFKLGYYNLYDIPTSPAIGSFHTFTRPTRVYEQTTSTAIDPDTAPFLDVGPGQALRRTGNSVEANRLLENCEVVEISEIETERIISFNSREQSTANLQANDGDPWTGLTVSGPTIPASIPSGGHVGIQVIGLGHYISYIDADDSPNLLFPTFSYVSRARSSVDPLCRGCMIHTSTPCIGDSELFLFATLSTTITLLEVIKEVSGETTDPDFSTDVGSGTDVTTVWGIRSGEFRAVRSADYTWGGFGDPNWVIVEEMMARLERHPTRPNEMRVVLESYISFGYNRTTPNKLYAHAIGTTGGTNNSAGLNLARNYMIIDIDEFNCTDFAIDLDYELGPDAEDGSAIAGKKWTLASL
jgi:hypothetical protein